MKTFTIQLQSAIQAQTIESATSFVGEDASGSFGIMAGHERMMTSLIIGMARFRVGDSWRYLAVPSALLYFHQNVLSLNTRRYLLDDDYESISAALRKQLLAEEANLNSMKKSLHHMEEEVLKRMWKIKRAG